MTRLRRLFLTRLGFRQQLVLTFTIGIACLTLGSSLAIATLSSQTVRAKLLQEGEQITQSFGRQSTLALLYHSPDNAIDAAQAMLAFPDVRGVAIFDASHRLLLAAGEDTAGEPEAAHWPQQLVLDNETPSAWYFTAPVFAGQPDTEADHSPFLTHPPSPELIGYVRVKIGKETLKRMAADILRGNLLLSSGIALVLLAVLLAITSRVTTPLRRLSEIMHRAQNGEIQVRAEERGPKDIVDMQVAFNTMMSELESREQQLLEAHEAALESARMKGEFAVNVSHELRTPLNGVLGMLELLHEMGLTPKQREYVEVARSAGESLLLLIDDMLDFSHLGSGKLKLTAEDFDLTQTLEEVVRLLAGQAQRKGLDLGYVIAPELPVALRGEPGRIRQVLINLMGNAIKFTEKGEVGVAVSVAGRDDGRIRVRFEVRDTGIGIPRESWNRIFDAFSQVDGSTTRKYGGTGLGLAICRQLVMLMDGEIGLDSVVGEGSRFWFELPLDLARDMQEPHEGPDLAGLRVLIVVDSDVTRTFLEQTFSAWETYHHTASEPQAALEQLRRAASDGRAYDLVLLDEALPSMSGTETIRRIQKDPLIAGTSVILMANPHQTATDDPRRPAIGAVISKPVQRGALLSAVTNAVKRKAEMRAGLAPRIQEEAGRLSGTPVLVVEDNITNQHVAVAMLERLGCRPEVAANGQDALEAVSRARFELILMDCQMPQMDGYQTTQRLRALEGEGEHAHVPIIAMTANVQEGDAEKCIAAGMDDYLPKPLTLDALREKLQQWVGPSALLREVTAVADCAGTAAGELQALDGEALSELRESVGESFAHMIEVFLEDTPACVEEIEQAVADDDGSKLCATAHRIKGSVKNFGAERLAGIAKQLEDLARSGTMEGAAPLVSALLAEFERVKNALEHEIKPERVRPGREKVEHPRILVVDDDRAMCFALRTVLEQDGYRIEEARNGAEAIAVCERHMPDLVLMDALMPVMDGFAACKRLRDLPGGALVPLLVITSLDDEHAIEEAFSAGATDYIPKPVHFAVLRQRVARLLRASRAERHVRRLAYHDELTGLPNRAMFKERLGEMLARKRGEDDLLAVLFLDLDRFKVVNDTLGHEVGDLLLKAASERILRCVRSSDLVARLGGDEFTVVLDGIRSSLAAATVADNICNALADPFVLMGQEMYVTASIGVSFYPADGNDIAALIKHADTAMFRAKEQRSNYRFYEQDMEAAVTRRMELDGEMRRALARNEFVLYYQPVADFTTEEIVGMESLLRWNHPERGLVSPAEIIPLAEETGFIVSIGEWVLRSACTQLQEWVGKGYGAMHVAVNISGRQFDRGGLYDTIVKVLEETALSPSLLRLEITESVIMESPERIIPVLRQLRQLGVHLSVDDFGTGYSSLSHLKRFPVDVLKIDRSFVRDILTDPADAAIVTGIVALARSLGLRTVAEGVENAEQHEALKRLECNMVQGYHLGRPMPAAAFEEAILGKSARTPETQRSAKPQSRPSRQRKPRKTTEAP
jgi:diguanylate cyclase (GGDEF)-like protein